MRWKFAKGDLNLSGRSSAIAVLCDSGEVRWELAQVISHAKSRALVGSSNGLADRNYALARTYAVTAAREWSSEVNCKPRKHTSVLQMTQHCVSGEEVDAARGRIADFLLKVSAFEEHGRESNRTAAVVLSGKRRDMVCT